MKGRLPRVVLIRAAATDLDVQGRIGGRLDVPLCERGLAQAQQTAEDLDEIPLAVVYHAPCQAAMQTAETISAARSSRVKMDAALANFDFGLWHGKSLEELKACQPWLYRCWLEHPETVCPPEGEEFDQARRRIAACLKRLAARHGDQWIGIVVSAPIAALIGHLYGAGDLVWLWSQQAGDGSWQVLEAAPAMAVV